MSWNKNSAKVIGITAAAAMALSLAPATAFTAYAAPRNGSSVSEQANTVSNEQNFRGGHISGLTIGNVAGKLVTPTTGEPYIESTIAPTSANLGILQFTTQEGKQVTLFRENSSSTNYYDEDGNSYSFSLAGDTLNLSRIFGSVPVTKSIRIQSVAHSLQGAVIAGPVSYAFDKADHRPTLNFMLNGRQLPDTEYRVVDIRQGNTSIPSNDALNAGHYVAFLDGQDRYAGSNNVQVPFTVSPIDLSTASVEIEDTDSSSQPGVDNVLINGKHVAPNVPAAPATLGHPATPAQYTELEVTTQRNPSGNNVWSDLTHNGAYTLRIAPIGDLHNYTNHRDITVNRVATVLPETNFHYNGGALSAIPNVNLDASTGRFDPALVTVSNGSQNLDRNQFNVIVEKQDANGNYVASTADAMNTTAGTYRVTVKVNASATHFNYGGQASTEVVVSHQTPVSAYAHVNGNQSLSSDADAANDLVTYNGKNVNVAVSVQNATTTIPASNYTVAYRNIDTNHTVDSIRDAGHYTVTITLNSDSGYRFGNHTDGSPDLTATFNLTVKPLDVSAAIDPDSALNTVTYTTGTGASVITHTKYQFAHTGQAVNPGLVFTDNQGNKWDVPTSGYAVRYTNTDSNRTVRSAVDNGNYSLTVYDILQDNFVISTNTWRNKFQITNVRHFTDVPNNSWFVKFVNRATAKNLMHGYGDSDLFGPYNKLTRAEAAVILSNWAHAVIPGTDPDETIMQNLGNHGYSNSFKDVKPSTAQSGQIAWATKVGLMTGDPKTKLFRPNDPLTRQEFATIVNRFAKASQKHDGDYKAASLSALDSYSDENKVAPWAREGVAWTVANGVMGKGTNNKINPNNSIIRAEVAAMIVRADDVINK